jgi:hypothetical protein
MSARMTPLWLAMAGGAGWLLLSGPGKKQPKAPQVVVKAPTAKAGGSVKVEIPPGDELSVDLSLLNDMQSEILATGSLDEIYREAMSSYHRAFITAAAARLAASGDSRAIKLVARLANDEVRL